MICTDCYNQLVSKHVASMVTLPGVVQTGRMERLNAPGGRCHVCNIHPVTWIDRESYLGLCDSCYEREKNLTTREETA